MGKVTPEIKSKIIELYKDGCSSVEISKRLGISQPYISRIIKSENITRDRNIPLNKDNKLLNEVVNLYKSGFGCSYISKKLGIPKHNISYYIKKEGIMRKPERNSED
jgi:predicted transcriptional regulator